MTDPDQRADAVVTTDAPERYGKQLAAHLGRRCEIREETAGTRIVLPDEVGSCLLVLGDGTLTLRAVAPTQEGLDRVTDVIGSHLERFGQRNELQVSWQPR